MAIDDDITFRTHTSEGNSYIYIYCMYIVYALCVAEEVVLERLLCRYAFLVVKSKQLINQIDAIGGCTVFVICKYIFMYKLQIDTVIYNSSIAFDLCKLMQLIHKWTHKLKNEEQDKKRHTKFFAIISYPYLQTDPMFFFCIFLNQSWFPW